MMKRIAVIGAGPAGLLAAAYAKNENTSVEIFDGNEKVGKKLFLTGKGRCNITNIASKEEFMQNIPRNPRFLYSAFNTFFNSAIISIIEKNGVPTKVERGGRVFPASDKSSDVIKALLKFVNGRGVNINLNTRIRSIEKTNDGFLLNIYDGTSGTFDSVIIATGGVSYPSTGSTGDGYEFARSFGHTIIKTVPSLISLITEEKWTGELAGLSLKNVVLTAYKGKNKVYSELGEMLFTHKLFIDMKPALDEATLEARVLRDMEQNKHRQMKNAIQGLLPSRMVPIVLMLAGIDPEKTTDSFTKTERRQLVAVLKSIPLNVKAASDISEALITRGGINIKEVNPKTMESKLVPGLYFAGEVLDVDAYTGGFNLQIAYSTGVAAGLAAAE